MIALAALPFAAAAASDTYAHEELVSEQQTRSRHLVTATLLADGPSTGNENTVTDKLAPTDATWPLPDGTRGVGRIPAGQGTLKGAQVSVWLDEAGSPTAPPRSEAAVALESLVVGLGLWLGLCFVFTLAYLLVRHLLDRRRSARWADEWLRLEEQGTRSPE